MAAHQVLQRHYAGTAQDRAHVLTQRLWEHSRKPHFAATPTRGMAEMAAYLQNHEERGALGTLQRVKMALLLCGGPAPDAASDTVRMKDLKALLPLALLSTDLPRTPSQASIAAERQLQASQSLKRPVRP